MKTYEVNTDRGSFKIKAYSFRREGGFICFYDNSGLVATVPPSSVVVESKHRVKNK